MQPNIHVLHFAMTYFNRNRWHCM